MRKNMGLYRGKRKDTGEWVEGNLFENDNTHFPMVLIGHVIMSRDKHFPQDLSFDGYALVEVDPETVGMCSGVPDKHGNLIYEDDFVRVDDDVKEMFKRVEDGPVRFSRGSFFVNSYGDFLSSFDVIADFMGVLRGEVIGNIHDNPELLEEVK